MSPVVSAVQRDGKVRSRVLVNVNGQNLIPILGIGCALCCHPEGAARPTADYTAAGGA
jgi:hypothetical protein